MTDRNDPLFVIRAIEFEHVFSGLAAAFKLAVLNADMIRAERPGRDKQRRPTRLSTGKSPQATSTSKRFSLDIDPSGGHEVEHRRRQ